MLLLTFVLMAVASADDAVVLDDVAPNEAPLDDGALDNGEVKRAAKKADAKVMSAPSDVGAADARDVAPDEAAFDESVRTSKKSQKVIYRGSLRKSEIQSVIRTRMLEIKHCYEQYLMDGGERMGKVNTKFTIGKEGRVIKNEVTSAVAFGPKMLGCIKHVIDTLVFPKPKGGGMVFVNYPFVFSASAAPPRKRFKLSSCLWPKSDPPPTKSTTSLGGGLGRTRGGSRALEFRTNRTLGGTMPF